MPKEAKTVSLCSRKSDLKDKHPWRRLSALTQAKATKNDATADLYKLQQGAEKYHVPIRYIVTVVEQRHTVSTTVAIAQVNLEG